MSVLDANWMTDVAAGNAPRAVRVLAACHAELNETAQTQLSDAEAVMGALLEQTQPAPLKSLSFDRLDLTPAEPEPSPIGERQQDGKLALPQPSQLPPSLQSELKPLDTIQWKTQLGGIKSLPLEHLSEDGVKARLLCLPAGMGVAHHTHADHELTLVLSGGFHDGQAAYHAGDVCEAGPDLVHAPKAFDDEDCLCLAVELGALKFTHPFFALADRILGWSRS